MTDKTRPTIIDFVEKYTRQFPDHVYLREKVDGKWKEITQEQTRETAYRIGAGLMCSSDLLFPYLGLRLLFY